MSARVDSTSASPKIYFLVVVVNDNNNDNDNEIDLVYGRMQYLPRGCQLFLGLG